ncbi:MAG: CHAT domain-containing protein [Acetobacteraceae bacterium]|nr:CHAT domain-containing protein [Acetobacteraceae bacterium]
MNTQAVIGTADPLMFDTLAAILRASGLNDIHPERLVGIQQIKSWLGANEPSLLVLDARMSDSGAAIGPDPIYAALDLLNFIRGSDPRTPVLILVTARENNGPLERACIDTGRVLMLPMNILAQHQHKIVRPFLAMLTGVRSGNSAIPGAFSVIETEIYSDRVECRLTTDDGAPMVLWNKISDVSLLKSIARDYAGFDVFRDSSDTGRWIGTSAPHNWLQMTRADGEKLFKTFVLEAVGEHLFAQMEQAAGGLEGLSFRFNIKDGDLFPAPFEASVRLPDMEEDSPFILLRAPIVRGVKPGANYRIAPQTARVEHGARLLFVSSQAAGDGYDRVVFDGKTFDKLGNIDLELNYLKQLDRAGSIQLELVDLAEAPPGKASTYLRDKINELKPDILHYAGHAWSDGKNTATLILPGADPANAIGLRLDKLTTFEGLSSTKLVYLSACRGISRSSVQQLVMNGIPYALGFRWNVEDERAPRFAEAFYARLVSSRSVCLAFRHACRSTWEDLDEPDDSPIWLSPILLAQSADWAKRSDGTLVPALVA